jgi:glutamate synthase domain-containing protein 2
MLQDAVNTESYAKFKKYSEAVRRLPPINLRDLLDFKSDRTPVPIDEVESITELRKRLVAPGISLGALGPEAHETLSIAMNRIGAKSDSGEGGEDPARYSRARTATTPRRRSSRWRRAASASRRSISTTAASSRSRSRRAPSPAKAASCPASRSAR